MKLLLLLFVTKFLLLSPNYSLAEVHNGKENIVNVKAGHFFHSGLQRLLIIPQINLYDGERVKRAEGVGVIAGEDVRLFEKESSLTFEPVERMLNPSIYQIYTLYNNIEFKEDKHILWCEVENDKVNIMIKNGQKNTFFRVPEKLSKLILSSLVKKIFSWPPLE